MTSNHNGDNHNPAMKKSGLKGNFPSGSGGSTSNGLSERYSIDSDPKSEGMCTRGPNQMPLSMPAKKVGKFEFC